MSLASDSAAGDPGRRRRSRRSFRGRATEKERRAAAEEVERVAAKYRWRAENESERLAAWLASLGTATARQIAPDSSSSRSTTSRDRMAASRCWLPAADRSPRRSPEGSSAEELWSLWPLLRRPCRQASSSRRNEPATSAAWSAGVDSWATGASSTRSIAGLVAEPALLDARSGTSSRSTAGSELENAHAWDTGRWDKSKRANPDQGENRWVYALTGSPARAGSTAAPPDVSLDALMRDFRASTVGWYAQLHEALEPTRRSGWSGSTATSPCSRARAGGGQARARRAAGGRGRTRAPDGSRAPSPTPLTQHSRRLSRSRRFAARARGKREPGSRTVLLEAAAQALGHEQADVQERALKLLEHYAGGRCRRRAVAARLRRSGRPVAAGARRGTHRLRCAEHRRDRARHPSVPGRSHGAGPSPELVRPRSRRSSR